MRKGLSALVLVKIMASGWAWAQPAPSPALSGWGGAGDVAWAGGALVLVLAVLLLFLKALQHFGRFRRKAGRGALFEMRGYQPLDNRKYLAAVAVDGRLLIIGVTPDNLVPLGQWPLRDEEFQALLKPGGLDQAGGPPAAEAPARDQSSAGPGEKEAGR